MMRLLRATYTCVCVAIRDEPRGAAPQNHQSRECRDL